MTQWMLTIPFINGEDKKAGLLRIHNLMSDSAIAQGFAGEPVKPAKAASQIWSDMSTQASEQRVKMQIVKAGRMNFGRARSRNFAAPFEDQVDRYTSFTSGDETLNEIYRKIIPEITDTDLERMADSSTARKKAFDDAIDGMVGMDNKIRNRKLSSSDKFLKSYIIGHAPARGVTLSENRARELQSIVKASLGGLGMADAETTDLLQHRIQSRPLLMNEKVEKEFRHMIHAYHEMREHNSHYLQAMMGGMDGAENPEGVLSALLPSPDDIMRGAIGHLIVDLNMVPAGKQTVTVSDHIRKLWDNILNFEAAPAFIKGGEKEKSVGRLLALYGSRKQLVRAVEQSIQKAQMRGADFISAFQVARPNDITSETILALIKQPEDIDVTEEDTAEGLTSNLLTNDNKVQTRLLLAEMEEVGLAYPIAKGRRSKDTIRPHAQLLGLDPVEIHGSFFSIIPIELPTFSQRPVGWDRRWMVATMRVIDEYWGFIFSEEGILLSNLLYLVASRTEELFNYQMDATEVTQLAILLSKESSMMADEAEGAARRKSARRIGRRGGILPVIVKEGEIKYKPLKSLTKLLGIGSTEEEVAELEEENDALEEENDALEEEHEGLVTLISRESEEPELDPGEAQDLIEDELREIEGNFLDELKELGLKEKNINSLLDTGTLKLTDRDKKRLAENAAELGTENHNNNLEHLMENWDGDVDLDWINDDEYRKNKLIDLGFKLEMYDEDGWAERAFRDLDLEVGLPARRRARMKLSAGDGGTRSLGLVHAEVIIGVNLFRDIGGGLRDVFGGRSKIVEKQLMNSMTLAKAELKSRAKEMGATSVRNIRIEPFTYGGKGSMIGLVAVGDAYGPAKNKVKKNSPWDEELDKRERAGEITDHTAGTLVRCETCTHKWVLSKWDFVPEWSDQPGAGSPKCPSCGAINATQYVTFTEKTILDAADKAIPLLKRCGHPRDSQGLCITQKQSHYAHLQKFAKKKSPRNNPLKNGAATTESRVRSFVMSIPESEVWNSRDIATRMKAKYSRSPTSRQIAPYLSRMQKEGMLKKRKGYGNSTAYSVNIGYIIALDKSNPPDDDPVCCIICGSCDGCEHIPNPLYDTTGKNPRMKIPKPFQPFVIDGINLDFQMGLSSKAKAESIAEKATAKTGVKHTVIVDDSLYFVMKANPPDVFGVNREMVHVYLGQQGIYGMTDEMLQGYGGPLNAPDHAVTEHLLGSFPAGTKITVVLPPKGPPKAVVGKFPKNNVILAETGNHGQLPFTGLTENSSLIESAQQRYLNETLGYDQVNPPIKVRPRAIAMKCRICGFKVSLAQYKGRDPLPKGADWSLTPDASTSHTCPICETPNAFSGVHARPITFKNPKGSNTRKYKGHIILKQQDGWVVEAYDLHFKTLKEAREYITKHVSGTASANKQCVRTVSGHRCKGLVVFIKSNKYRCDGCNAEYKEA
jgi:uncharacterized protein YbjQ (UPF0145 family)